MYIEETQFRHPKINLPGIRSTGGSSTDVIRSILRDLEPKLGKSPCGSPEFEVKSPIGEENREALVKFMLGLPDGEGQRLFRQSVNLDYIVERAARSQALERMYTGAIQKIETTDYGYPWARLFIENIHNSMAVRNRLRIVEQVFGDHMRKLLAMGVEDINVLSIAAGSSRGMIEALARLNGDGHDKIKLRLVDIDPEALEAAEELSRNFNIGEAIETYQTNFLRTNRYLGSSESPYKPHFVEIVGLFDYVNDAGIVRYLSRLKTNLAENGVIILSNIENNHERPFTHKIVGWTDEMIYRYQYELLSLVEQAGFEINPEDVYREPLGIYNLVVARK